MIAQRVVDIEKKKNERIANQCRIDFIAKWSIKVAVGKAEAFVVTMKKSGLPLYGKDMQF